MEFSFFKGAVWQLIKQMDWIAIGILIALFCLSVFCVAIIAFKSIAFRYQRKQLALLQSRLRHVKTFSEIIAIGKELRDGIGGKLLMRNLAELRNLLDRQPQKRSPFDQPEETSAATLTTSDIEILEASVAQSIDALLLEEEIYLPILSTSAVVSPLVGLFGTIWGLIHAFVDISQEKSADIATVAPGMAEALIVTLAGLIVAIPAMIAFHYFSNQLRKIDFQLNEIGEKFLHTVKQTFVK